MGSELVGVLRPRGCRELPPVTATSAHSAPRGSACRAVNCAIISSIGRPWGQLSRDPRTAFMVSGLAGFVHLRIAGRSDLIAVPGTASALLWLSAPLHASGTGPSTPTCVHGGVLALVAEAPSW